MLLARGLCKAVGGKCCAPLRVVEALGLLSSASSSTAPHQLVAHVTTEATATAAEIRPSSGVLVERLQRSLASLEEAKQAISHRTASFGPFGTSVLDPLEKVETKVREVYRDVEVPVTNFQGEDRGTAVLGGDVFNIPIRADIVHRVVVWQLAKRRQGTSSTKTRSTISGTGKKPYKQKGLGRARHGDLRGPQFRGGAIAHGPQPRDWEHKLNKKVRRLGLKAALSARLAEGRLLVFDSVTPASHKTKDFVQSVESLDGSKKVLVVDGRTVVNPVLQLASGNLPNVHLLPWQGLNVYSILQHDLLILHIDAVRRLEARLRTPINR
ncbi:mitochondrial ribosomal protein L4 precursor [Klebsormidium nitens]|uniref:Large ribosomal subunit protein uL4m n=1 Tax=Klebsormidium nitens TaxID=105231 RepID=A0A1Y1ISM7_KLENI|nr:mitochondrial ribosomal protein L4 precursor [Klebsormidium nitens]|eukprot:GAQ91776.1 mitochondrial ribosomal protein L4 precursor [Klebsormidium nitens]